MKASLDKKEHAMLRVWRQGYQRAFSCFPRLHLITYAKRQADAERMFHGVPNVTVRRNDFPPLIERAGRYFLIQWHLVWADNFTTAPHILFFDVDAVPILPFHCHQFFDSQERAIWHSWLWRHQSPWVQPCTRVFCRAHAMGETFERDLSALFPGSGRQGVTLSSDGNGVGMCGASANATRSSNTSMSRSLSAPTIDFMTTFPLVVPRRVLPEMRRLVSLVEGTYFDAAFVKLRFPSHGDLIGKTLLLQFPDLINFTHCPNPTRAHQELGGEPNRCRLRISPVEHIRHPLQDCHAARCKYLSAGPAAQYGSDLLNRSRYYAEGLEPLPPVNLHQYSGLTMQEHELAARGLLTADETGHVCGVPRGRGSG